MKRLLKLVVAAVILLLAVVVIGSLVLRFYFSDERLRSLILPPVREALGRKVDFKSCSIDLIRGVELSGLVVKEADGQTDFLAVNNLSLGYSFSALLQRRLEISKLDIDGITVNLFRDRQGAFNYQSLKIMAVRPAVSRQRSKTPPVSFAGPGAAAGDGPPIEIVFRQCRLNNLRLRFHDALKELPDLDVKADFSGRFDFSRGFAPENFDGSGRLAFTLDALYRGLSPRAEGKIDFDPQSVRYRVETRLKEQTCTLSGSLSDYLSKLPRLVLNLDSPRLDLAYLAGLADRLGQPAQKGAPVPAAEKSGKSEPTSPPPLIASGKIRIGEAVYENWKIEKFAVDYDYREQRLKLSGLQGEVAGGSLAGDTELKDFPARPDFAGNLSFTGLEVSQLQKMAAPDLPRQVNGRMQGKFKFSGRGRKAESLKQNLSVVGDYALEEVKLESTPLARQLAATLGIPELKNLSLDRLDGNLRLVKGLLHLNSQWSGRQLKGRAVGTVGLDGRLDLPVSLVFNRDLSTRLVRKYAWLEGAMNDQGEATLALFLNGSVNNPKVRLDRARLQRQLGKSVQKKLEKRLYKQLNKGFDRGDSGKAAGRGAEKSDSDRDLGKRLRRLFE